MTPEEQHALAVWELRTAGYTIYAPECQHFYEQIRTADDKTVMFINDLGDVRGPQASTASSHLKLLGSIAVPLNEAPARVLVKFAKQLLRENP